MNVAIIGIGKFGRALAVLLEENGHTIERVARGDTMSAPADIVFLSVPTQALREAVAHNSINLNKSSVVVNCSKGIEEGSHLLPHQIIREFICDPNYATLTGPSFASEIIEHQPTVVSLGCADKTSSRIICNAIETSYFRLSPQESYRDLELGGALKNVYAILCGYAHGLGLGPNTQVRIILQARREIVELADAAGYPITQPDSPGILGDLILTCTSKESRNYTYGAELAKHHATSPNTASTKTIEGFHTSHSVAQLVSRHNTNAPLVVAAANIVSGKFMNIDSFNKLMSNLPV